MRGVPVSDKDVFFDLGSGDGRLTLGMLVLTPVQAAAGIELSPTGISRRWRLRPRPGAQPARRRAGKRLRLICGNMLIESTA